MHHMRLRREIAVSDKENLTAPEEEAVVIGLLNLDNNRFEPCDYVLELPENEEKK